MPRATVEGGPSGHDEGGPVEVAPEAALVENAIDTAKMTKAQLVALVVAQGTDEDEARGLTRLQLVAAVQR